MECVGNHHPTQRLVKLPFRVGHRDGEVDISACRFPKTVGHSAGNRLSFELVVLQSVWFIDSSDQLFSLTTCNWCPGFKGQVRWTGAKHISPTITDMNTVRERSKTEL